MLRIIGTLIDAAIVQFRVSPRDRAGDESVHNEVNLITQYGCQIQARPFHPVHVRTIRVYAKGKERMVQIEGSTLFNGRLFSRSFFT